MQPGDLVRVNSRSIAQLAGKIGIVVEAGSAVSVTGGRPYKVLLDGGRGIYYFYAHQLELVQAAPGMIQ
jgi:hypothetical protein